MNERKTILDLYERYIIEEMNPSKDYLELKIEFYNDFEKLSKTLEERKKHNLEKICETLFKMENEYGKNCFERGFLCGSNLSKELFS